MAVRRNAPCRRRRANATARWLGTVAVCSTVLAASVAHAAGTLVVAMTAGDIPVTTGNPDQGFEGLPVV
jgi:hypothetical protein